MYLYNGFCEDDEAVEPYGWWVSVLVRSRSRGVDVREGRGSTQRFSQANRRSFRWKEGRGPTPKSGQRGDEGKRRGQMQVGKDQDVLAVCLP